MSRSFDSALLLTAIVFGIGGGVVLLFQFMGLRVRNAALPADDRDPQLGRKFALGLFLHLSVLLLLLGLTVSAVDVFEELVNGDRGWNAARRDDPIGVEDNPAGPALPPGAAIPPPPPKPFFNGQQRLAAGLVLSGVLHGVLFAMLLLFGTNSRRFPAVGRAFVVNRLLTAGLTLMGVSTTFCIHLFAEDGPTDSPFGWMLGTAVVWGPAGVGHLLWLLVGLRREKAKAALAAEMAPPRAEAG